jgi:hypothetical protein
MDVHLMCLSYCYVFDLIIIIICIVGAPIQNEMCIDAPAVRIAYIR